MDNWVGEADVVMEYAIAWDYNENAELFILYN